MSSAEPGGNGLTAKVLLISDEIVAAKVWAFSLTQLGLEVTLISTTDAVMDIWENEHPDMVIIEDFDDQIDEIEVCKQLRGVSPAPILLLTAKQDERFYLKAYQAGVDECVAFPITPRLFQAKVNAWLRRTQTLPLAALDEVRAGWFVLNASQRQLTLPTGDTIKLTMLESRLMFLLMSHPEKLFETSELTDRVWGYYGEGDNGLLKNLVYRLRRKIEDFPAQPSYLITEGLGYKFTPLGIHQTAVIK